MSQPRPWRLQHSPIIYIRLAYDLSLNIISKIP